MISFFNSYKQQLLAYSAIRVQQNPNDILIASTHLALVQLIKHLEHVSEQTANGQLACLTTLQQNASKQDDPLSLFIVGMVILEGNITMQQDKLTGYLLVKLAAARGCYFANTALGVWYMQGNEFIEHNLLKAKNSFLQALAIVPNDLRALRNLGICYFKLGDYQDGVKVLKAAALQGDNTLQQMYGKPFPKDAIATKEKFSTTLIKQAGQTLTPKKAVCVLP